MNRKTKKALNITSYVLIGLVFLMAVMVLMLNLSVKSESDVPKLFGTSVMYVETNSMKKVSREPNDIDVDIIESRITFSKGDLILIKRLNTLEARSTLAIGDVITYWVHAEHRFNTHMIVASTEPTGGVVRYVTRGVGLDADTEKPIPQNSSSNDSSVSSADIIGVVKGKLSGMGAVFKFFQSFLGFGLLIVLPLFAFLAYRIYIVVKLAIAINKEKKEGTTLSEMEKMQAEIEKLKAELKGDKAENKGARDGPVD